MSPPGPGDEEVEGAHPGSEPPRLVAVAVTLALGGALVGSRSHVLGHLRFEHLLEDSVHDLPEETCIVQQTLLRPLRVQPTMIGGHRPTPFRWVDFRHQPSWRTMTFLTSGPPIYRTLRAQPTS